VLQVRGESETFVFEGVAERPVPSLLREFSAPVHLDYPYTQDELLFLLAHDQDGFARWEAGQKLSLRTIQSLVDARIQGGKAPVDARFLEVFGRVLKNPGSDEGLAAELLTLPDQAYIEQIQSGPVHPDHVWGALNEIKREIGRANAEALKVVFDQRSQPEAYRYEAQAMGRRALKNTALAYLCRGGVAGALAAALTQVKTAQNHTDEVSALRILSEYAGSEREEAMTLFYSRWHKDGVVMNKWFATQASSSVGDGLARVQGLLADPAFQAGNPNHVRSVLGAFASANTAHFHRVDGEGYRFFADQVLAIDGKNPSLAARLVSSFNQWKRFESARKAKMGAELERLARHKLSPGTGEVVSKALQG
jgi:aminopeptidase N